MSSSEASGGGEHGTQPLRDLVLAVTRPAEQADATCAALRAAGAEVIRFPVMEIVAVPPGAELLSLAQRIGACDLAVFISANAVRHGLALLQPYGGLPSGVRVAAVGGATARALAEAGVEVSIRPPSGFNSEALLAHPALRDVAGAEVLVFRGVGGRALLGDTLRARGAKVHYAEVYRRVRARPDIGPLTKAWQQQRLDLVVVTSGEGLRFLLDCVGPDDRQALLRTPLAVIGERMLQQARNAGFESDIVVTEPGDQALVTALRNWRQTANRE